jgi:hypothetical protein
MKILKIRYRYVALFLAIIFLIAGCDLDSFDRQFSAHIDNADRALDQSVGDMDRSLNETMDKLTNIQLANPLEGWQMPKFPQPEERQEPKAGSFQFSYQFDGSVPEAYQSIVQEAGAFWAGYISTEQTIALNVSIENAEDSWLAKAAPTQIAANNLPSGGRVVLNVMFADILESDRDYFKAVVIHEMGHVLGIGTLWEPLGLIDASSATYRADSNAGRFYQQPIPVQPQVLAHWDEDVFKNELMTPIAQKHIDVMDVTFASLRDIGWQVDRLDNKQLS